MRQFKPKFKSEKISFLSPRSQNGVISFRDEIRLRRVADGFDFI